jgi:hypothetical protein
MKRILLLFALAIVACQPQTAPEEYLSPVQLAVLKDNLLPFVIKKPDQLTYENRTDTAFRPLYREIDIAQQGIIKQLYPTDTAWFFVYHHKDRSSLFEHYRELGGYLKMDDQQNITYLNLLYHTPRWTPEEVEERSNELFQTMISKGSVQSFIGNKAYIKTPNEDFIYDPTINRWIMTENSSWKFLNEVEQR